MEMDGSSINGHADSCHLHYGQAQIRENLSEHFEAPSIHSYERQHVLYANSVERMADTISDNGIGPSFLSDSQGRQLVESTQLTEAMSEMQQKISYLEKQIVAISKGGINIDKVMRSATSNNQIGESVMPRAIGDILPKPVSVIAEIREASWTDFMRRFEDDENQYAVEVLIGEPEYQHASDKYVGSKKGTAKKSRDKAAPTKQHSPPKVFSSIPERIRINSPCILEALAKFDKNIDPSASIVMLGPYKLLVHFEDKIREIAQSSRDKSPHPDFSSEKQPMSNLENGTRDLLTSERDLQDDTRARHLQCLVKFIDQYVKPVLDRLESNRSGRIHFRDLWYLFPPGEDLFMPLKDRQLRVNTSPMKMGPEMFQGRYERRWRVIGTGGGRPNMSTISDRDQRIKQNAFQADCYYIDFDGRYFCPVVHQFSIQPFSGERDITSLDFFPLRYAQRGREFYKHCRLIFDALQQSHTHFYYRGPTLTTHPCGCPIQGVDLHQEHVESEVIIDYRTTLLKHPSWRPRPSFWKIPPSRDDEVQSKHRVYHYRDRTGSQLIRTDMDQVYDDNTIDREMALIYKDKAQIFNPVPSGWLSNETSVPEHDIALISARVFVFVLRTRSFAPVWMWSLQKISAQTDGLHNLQLRDNSFKDTIHALVRTHFLHANHHEDPDSDSESEAEPNIIQAKGQGLVLLLHGAPGVGKTFTAESVAAANGRPLFQITCGDLGLTPSEVERALKEIFQYAQLWNCVLLLDECDIFLTQRTKADLNRNSLVSVFLRVLEWYNGVLFLTTNRVGALDSAVRSRITWSAYYPPLNQAQTKKIWKAGLDRVEKIHTCIEVDKKSIMRFAQEHFKATVSDGLNWNGRQIQNALKVAVSLADWDTLTGEEQHATDIGIHIKEMPRRPRLTASHFKTVAEAAEAFNEYLVHATGLTEAQRAWNAQERADDYQDEEETSESDGNDRSPEPFSKKRRVSSVGLKVQAQSHGGNTVQFQSVPNPRRRSSTSQYVKPSLSRRMSQQQQQQVFEDRQPWGKNGAYIKNAGDTNFSPTAITLSPPPAQNQGSFLNQKRKRSMSDAIKTKRSPSVNVETGSAADFSNERPHVLSNHPDAYVTEEGTNDDGDDDGHDEDWE